jgi:hypothetical protein
VLAAITFASVRLRTDRDRAALLAGAAVYLVAIALQDIVTVVTLQFRDNLTPFFWLYCALVTAVIFACAQLARSPGNTPVTLNAHTEGPLDGEGGEMALELPEWLVMAFNLVGLPWPGIDEDQLRAWASSVRRFNDDIVSNSSKANQTMRELADSSQSSVISGVAEAWEHHHQLLVDRHGPIGDFAEALDVAAEAVVVQKEAVIAAAVILAGEFTATQVGAIFTLGADEAALPGEIAITREVVKEALERLASALLQVLIQDAVLIAVDHINQAIGNLLTAGSTSRWRWTPSRSFTRTCSAWPGRSGGMPTRPRRSGTRPTPRTPAATLRTAPESAAAKAGHQRAQGWPARLCQGHLQVPAPHHR